MPFCFPSTIYIDFYYVCYAEVGRIVLNLFENKLAPLASGNDMESPASVFSCSDPSLEGGGLFFTVCCHFLMQNFYLCKEMHDRHMLRLCDPQQFTINSSFFFLPCRTVQPGKCYYNLINFRKCILDWIDQTSFSMQASPAGDQVRAGGACTEGWEWVGVMV